ncbi:MAG: hypothetical protein ABRQ23_01585 [Syntrophomonadaceae bacterium]
METKVYVMVLAAFDTAGTIRPISLKWEDGTVYMIDKVKAVRSAASMKAGGQGDRYTINVKGQEKYLFFERNTSTSGSNIGRWFVERR